MSELPSAQALPVELVPPPPPTSADNPELCAELDDVGDQELSWKTKNHHCSERKKKLHRNDNTSSGLPLSDLGCNQHMPGQSCRIC